MLDSMCILCPTPVEDCLPQQTQVLWLPLVLPSLSGSSLARRLKQRPLLLKLGYGLHRLKSETLCRVLTIPKMIVRLNRWQRYEVKSR